MSGFKYVRVLNIRKFSPKWQGSEYASECNYGGVLHIPGFRVCQVFAHAGVVQGSEYAWIWLNNVLGQGSEYVWSTFHRVLNKLPVLNVPRLRISHFNLLKMTHFNLPKVTHFSLPKITHFNPPKIEVLHFFENEIFQSPKNDIFHSPENDTVQSPENGSTAISRKTRLSVCEGYTGCWICLNKP